MIPLFRTEHLCKDYQLDGVTVPALHAISIEIQEGELVAIMGPSGCGKSTLMHLLGLLDTPTDGKIYFRGRLLNDFSENQRAYFRNREVGFVFQQFNLLPRLSALDNVRLPTLYRRSEGQNRPEGSVESTAQTLRVGEEATRLLQKVGLGSRLDHRPNQLSGGEQQRVAIARSLINSPSLILADEPTGNLDSRSGQEILALLGELNREGKTLVVVTHDANVAAICRRAIRMKDGEVVEE